MLARVMVWPIRLSVSVTSRCSIETAERIGLVFGTGVSFDLHFVIRKFMHLQNKGGPTFLWDYAPNSVYVENFAAAY